MRDNASSPAGMSLAEVRAYVGTIDAFAQDADAVARAHAWMSADERARYDRYRRDDDRMMFALGRSMARTLVGEALGIAPTAWQWREGPHGRPEIDAPRTDWHFNVSHSAGVVVCALGRGRALGVDLEDLQRRAPDPAVVPRYCSPSEAADVTAQGERWRDRFLIYWTLKEAYLKARGVGISVPLAEISFGLNGAAGPQIRFQGSLADMDNRWSFHLQEIEPHHLLAVAAATTDGIIPSIRILPYR